MADVFQLGVLISGTGTTLQNLIDRIADGRLGGVAIAIVISSRGDVEGVARAHGAGLPVEIVSPREFSSPAAFSARLVEVLEAHRVALAVQAGWMCYWRLPDRWLGRVLNVHPSLLPDFGGKGYYGRRVHEVVLLAGRSESGATVHIVDNQYDHGPVVLQRRCAVLPDDTVDSLARRVAAIERELLPAAIEQARDGRLPRHRAG
ncbi:MAG: phosphoribosylglycinamide formyltransferase [Phycisphaerae bacterium]